MLLIYIHPPSIMDAGEDGPKSRSPPSLGPLDPTVVWYNLN